MVKYLKYIVIIFGSIGVMIGAFFYYQNREDISKAMEYNTTLDYDNLKQNCLGIVDNYIYPCLKKEFSNYLSKVSLTGTNIGMKMVFTAMDSDKHNSKKFTDENHKQIEYSINYLELNNMAINNAYRRYFGSETMYGGFVASLNKYYGKAYEFSENIILGLDSHDGIQSLKDEAHKAQAAKRFHVAKERFYALKLEVEAFIEAEIKRLEVESK